MTTVPYRSPTTPAAEGPRVNVRLIAFLVIVSAPFVWIVGSAVRHSMSGGVVDRGGFKEVDLKALGNFPFDGVDGKLEDVPKRYRELDGQKVLLKGYMFAPQSSGSRGRKFEFVYNVSKCCFDGEPQVQERVFAYAKKDDIALYEQDVFAEVTGTLHVRVEKDAQTGKVTSVYDLDVETTKALD